MARKRRRKNKYARTATGMAQAGIGMGVGASVLGSSSFTGSAATVAGKGAEGIGNMAGFMPVIGTVAGAGSAIGMLDKMYPKRRARRRRKR